MRHSGRPKWQVKALETRGSARNAGGWLYQLGSGPRKFTLSEQPAPPPAPSPAPSFLPKPLSGQVRPSIVSRRAGGRHPRLQWTADGLWGARAPEGGGPYVVGITLKLSAIWKEFLQENSVLEKGISLAGNTPGWGCPPQQAVGTDLSQGTDQRERETLLTGAKFQVSDRGPRDAFFFSQGSVWFFAFSQPKEGLSNAPPPPPP